MSRHFALLALVSCCGLAQAQFLTPPPGHPDSLGRAIGPHRTPPRELVEKLSRERAERARQRLAEAAAAAAAEAELVALAPKLVERGNGTGAALKEPVAVAAARVNPLLSEMTRALVVARAWDHATRLENSLISNLDAFERAMGIVGTDHRLNDVLQIRTEIRSIGSSSRIIADLLARDELTLRQARVHELTVRKAMADLGLVPAEAPEPTPAGAFAAAVEELVAEARQVYDALLLVGADHAVSGGAALKLDDSQARSLGNAAGDLEAIGAWLQLMNLDDRRNFLRAARERRDAQR